MLERKERLRPLLSFWRAAGRGGVVCVNASGWRGRDRAEKEGPSCLEGGIGTRARLRVTQTELVYHGNLDRKPGICEKMTERCARMASGEASGV